MDIQKLVSGLSKSGAMHGFLGGVAGGSVTNMLVGKKSKKMGKSAVKIGALAAVGGLAWKAYQNYSSKQSAQTFGNASNQRFQYQPAQLTEQSFEQVVDSKNESGQMLIMRAMICAAYADGHIDHSERERIFAQVDQMALSVEEKATLFDELRNPLNVEQLVQYVPDAQTGLEVYAASASAIDLNQSVSQTFLDDLAMQLCIPTELKTQIHQELSI
ncbi:MAG: tellurite resistance TerB family protein [Pseudomonadota bacterium]